jgi:hypothetical protein
MPEGKIAPGSAGHSHWPTFDTPQGPSYWDVARLLTVCTFKRPWIAPSAN